MKSSLSFPEDFLWGAATASYQIEGSTDKEGRGASTWDTFSERPGKILNGDSGENACDHYNRWKEDIQLMKELGLKAYRFSIAWPRIFPQGTGTPNPEGVDFYNRLINGLIEAGITPSVTLFHWDLPQTLQDQYGGWKSKEVSRFFADYARFCGETFGDRVKTWFTINEISCFTILAHEQDAHAPGGLESKGITNQTVHNAMLGHGLALQALREVCSADTKIGLVENIQSPWPVIDTDKNLKAVHQAFYDLNQHILFPVLTGVYDEKGYLQNREILPEFTEEEMRVISTPMDFIAYNIYSGPAVRWAENDKGWEELEIPEKFPRSDMGWPVTPKCLYWAVMNTKNHFGDIPVYIAENGMAADDRVQSNGEILDIDRLEYYRSHLEMCARAIQDGAFLKGYFAWSLMDNFEWSYGYTKRFGLIAVNYRTQKRRIKLSGEYYREVIRNNRV